MAEINKILNGEGGLSVRDKLNEVIDKVNAQAVVVPVGDAPVFAPAKPGGYPAGSIVSYRNEASPDTQFQTFAIYVANSNIPVGVSPEDSAEWLYKGTEYIIQSGSTSTIYVRDIDGLRELQDMKTGESVIVQNEYAIYTFFANLETGIKPYIPGVGSWVKRKEISLSNLVYIFDSETAGNDIGLQIPVGGVILFFHNAGGFRWLDNEGATLHSIALTEPSIISRTGAGNTLSDFTILPIFGGGISWLELTDRPAWLSPASLALFEAAHGHDWSLIASKPATATRWPSWAEVTSKPATFTPAAHNQAISTITGLQAALDNKAEKAGDITQDFHVKDLHIAGQVNQWLAQQLVVDDARIQVNRKQGGATVDSGLVIYNKDTSSEVSSLVYDVNGIWRAGGQRIYTDAYKPLADNATNLGGYSAASYPRKAENATVTGNWIFGEKSASGPDNPFIDIRYGYTSEAKNRSASIIMGRGTDAYGSERYQIGVFADNAWGDATHFHIKQGTGVGQYTSRLTILKTSGFTGIGITTPQERLHVAGNGLFTGNVTAQNITLSGNLTSNSDIRKKENLKYIDNVLDKVLILKPTKYNFKDDESKRERIGLIAQELQEEFPQFVEEDDTEDKYLSVDYAGISVIAIKAIQELNNKLMSQIEIMGNRIKELEDKIDGLCN